MMSGEEALRKNVSIKVAILRKKIHADVIRESNSQFWNLELILKSCDLSVATLFIGLWEVEFSKIREDF